MEADDWQRRYAGAIEERELLRARLRAAQVENQRLADIIGEVREIVRQHAGHIATQVMVRLCEILR